MGGKTRAQKAATNVHVCGRERWSGRAAVYIDHIVMSFEPCFKVMNKHIGRHSVAALSSLDVRITTSRRLITSVVYTYDCAS